VNPTPQNRIDEFDHPPYGLANVSLEDLLELLQELRPFLQPKLPPFDRSTFRLFSSLISTLSFVISSRSRFSTAPISQSCGWEIDQYHQVMRKSRIEHWVFSSSRGRYRPFQHTIYLGEIEVTEHWRDHPALRNSFHPGSSSGVSSPMCFEPAGPLSRSAVNTERCRNRSGDPNR
jgi:hypothetical protein